MNKLLYITLFIIFSLTPCSTQNVQKKLPLNGEFYTIDLDQEKEPTILLSSLFKNIKTIILETNDECLVANIDDIQVFNEHIYILDATKSKCLYVFDVNGKFIRSIGRRGGGPGEYSDIKDITLDTQNHIIFLCDQNNRIHKYQLDGTFIQTITVHLPNTNAERIQYYNGRLYLSSILWEKGKDDYMLQEIDPSNGEIISRSVPLEYNKGANILFYDKHSRLFMSRANDPPRYNKMFMDYIVSIGEEVTPYIKLKSKHLTTKEDLKEFQSKEGSGLNITNINNTSKIFNISCFVENEDCILFRIGMSSDLVVLFNKKTNEVKLATRLINDLIYKKDKPNSIGRFMFSDTKGAYDLLNLQNHYIQNS